MSAHRYRNLTTEEEDRLRALPDFEEFEDAFVDTLTGLVHFAAFEDAPEEPLGYTARRWTRTLDGGAR